MEHEQPLPLEPRKRIGTAPLAAALCCVSALAAGIFVRDRQQSEAFDAERAQMRANLNQAVSQARTQVDDLNRRIDALVAAQVRPEPAKPSPVAKRAVTKAPRKPVVANDPRVDKLQGQLSDTQQELARTREELSGRINSTRDDLNGSLAQTRDEMTKSRDEMNNRLGSTRDEIYGKLDSTRSDLNGSIAKTNDEVAALRRRGMQNIYEFSLDKSKQFQRVGPISIELRSANPKRKTYDLAMMVEDSQLNKKHVNLYEPVWIRLNDLPQPVELVVNRVEKDRVVGYISEPKYRQADLASVSDKPVQRSRQLETR